jgi:hypothetical protein
MGARHLTIIRDNGKMLHHYGQWDGYPSGQGVIVLETLKTFNERKFRQNFEKAKLLTREEVHALLDPIKDPANTAGPGFMSFSTAALRKNAFPQLDRDMGAKVLAHIESGEDLRYFNDADFPADSLFCEWAYMVDFDTRQLRVFKGFNEKPLKEGQFYAHLKPLEKGNVSTVYYPSREVTAYSLDSLPTEGQFLADLEKADD